MKIITANSFCDRNNIIIRQYLLSKSLANHLDVELTAQYGDIILLNYCFR